MVGDLARADWLSDSSERGRLVCLGGAYWAILGAMSDLDPRATKPLLRIRRRSTPPSLRRFVWRTTGNAHEGLIAQHESGEIEGPLGLSWNTNDWNFLREQEDPPESVNPSLWRHGRHNAIHGLFEVAENVWQARGYDISNITFIKGDEGWVIVDPLTTSFTAKACLDLANATLGERPVTTVLYTHSHTDHYGGILGVTSTDEVDKGNVRILAPEGFMREAVAET